MFKPTNRQIPMFGVASGLADGVRNRLKHSWAEGFQAKVLPILLEAEQEFAALYSDETGRPNWSVARMLGICVLAEMQDLDDQSALDSLAFDVRWQHALGLTMEESYLSRRSLVEFRSRLVAEDPEMKSVRRLFERIGDAAIDELKLSTKEQRLDSTLIASNIFTRGRVELFRKTLFYFFEGLIQRWPEHMERLSPLSRRWYEENKEKGWFGKVDKDKAKQLAQTLAGQLYEVVQAFAGDGEVSADERYQLVARVFREHCEVETTRDGSGGGNGGDGIGNPPAKVTLRKKMESPSTSLQSPYDPDAGLGYKGPGYLVHVAETCRNEATEIITDYAVVPAGDNDSGKDAGVLDRLTQSGKKPDVLYEDGGYPTPKGIVEASGKGTEIVAPMTGGSLPADTIGRERFRFDAETGHCTSCPAGHAPMRHDMRSTYHDKPSALHAYFDGHKCRACALLAHCIVRPPNNGKSGHYHLEMGEHLIARDRALADQRNDEWWERYSIRSGIEATISELKRAHGLKKLRVRRMPRVRMAVSLKMTACNIKRWLRAVAGIERAAVRAQAVVCFLSASFQTLVRRVSAIFSQSRVIAADCVK